MINIHSLSRHKRTEGLYTPFKVACRVSKSTIQSSEGCTPKSGEESHTVSPPRPPRCNSPWQSAPALSYPTRSNTRSIHAPLRLCLPDSSVQCLFVNDCRCCEKMISLDSCAMTQLLLTNIWVFNHESSTKHLAPIL